MAASLSRALFWTLSLTLKLFDRHRKQAVRRRPAASGSSSYVPVSNYAKCQLQLQFTTHCTRVCV